MTIVSFFVVTKRKSTPSSLNCIPNSLLPTREMLQRTSQNGLEDDLEYSLRQLHLAKRIIDFIALSDSKLDSTLAEDKKLLDKDEEGPGRTYQCSYRSVIGMLNYLCGTRPDILFAVHQCAKNPKLLHEKAVKRIKRYLKHTPTGGIVLRPDSTYPWYCIKC